MPHPYDRISAAIGRICPVVEDVALDPLERLAFAVEALVDHVLSEGGLAEAPEPEPGASEVKAAGSGA